MERLTQWNKLLSVDIIGVDMHFKGVSLLDKALRKLAHYEDAEEQGRLVVLPCRVGTTLYFVTHPCDDTCCYWKDDDMENCLEEDCNKFIIKERTITLAFWEYNKERFGKDIFLTKPEAEQALIEKGKMLKTKDEFEELKLILTRQVDDGTGEICSKIIDCAEKMGSSPQQVFDSFAAIIKAWE